MPDNRPLIAHVLYRFAAGGLERDVLKLVNGVPRRDYRHAIITLTGDAEFRDRIVPAEVPVVTLDKRPGQDLRVYYRFFQALRTLRPRIVHTCNLATLELQVLAALAGVPGRVHGEFGWDMADLAGASRRYRLLRRLARPFVHRYVTVSRDLSDWLRRVIKIPAEKIRFIPRGVNLSRFPYPPGERTATCPPGFLAGDSFVVGTVARMNPVKNLPTLVRAFLRLLERRPESRRKLRLIMIGGGPEQEPCERLLAEAGAAELAWLPGERHDVPALLGAMDVFVSSSLAEGMPNAILEAMAAGLPVIATRVGGVPEIVTEATTGRLVEPRRPEAIAGAIAHYMDHPEQAATHGAAGRRRVEAEFSLDEMIAGYVRVFDELLKPGGSGRR